MGSVCAQQSCVALTYSSAALGEGLVLPHLRAAPEAPLCSLRRSCQAARIPPRQPVRLLFGSCTSASWSNLLLLVFRATRAPVCSHIRSMVAEVIETNGVSLPISQAPGSGAKAVLVAPACPPCLCGLPRGLPSLQSAVCGPCPSWGAGIPRLRAACALLGHEQGSWVLLGPIAERCFPVARLRKGGLVPAMPVPGRCMDKGNLQGIPTSGSVSWGVTRIHSSLLPHAARCAGRCRGAGSQ